MSAFVSGLNLPPPQPQPAKTVALITSVIKATEMHSNTFLILNTSIFGYMPPDLGDNCKD
jgi:hypothetical protein